MDMKQKVTVPDHVMFRELDGEAVLLNLENEAYYGLDRVGTRMWIVLEASDSIADAHTQLLAEYDVDAHQLKTDMIELIEELREHGLILLNGV
jgi:hypothetical protein